MFCDECGAENKDTASFCRKCGRRLDGDDETRVAKRDASEDDTRIYAREEDDEETRLRKRTERPVTADPPNFGYMPPSAAGAFVPEQVEHHPSKAATEGRSPSSEAVNEDEREIFAISPTLLFVKAGYVAAAIAALLLVALVSWLLGGVVSTSFAVVLGLALFLIPAYYHIRQRIIRYTLTETKLEVDTGLVSRQTRNVPLRRIQDVTVTTSIPQRLLGFGDILIDNASEEGGKLVLKNIDSPRRYADLLLKQMSRLEQTK